MILKSANDKLYYCTYFACTNVQLLLLQCCVSANLGHSPLLLAN